MKRVPFYCELEKSDSAKINRWARVGKIHKREVIALALTRLADTPAFSKQTVTITSGGAGHAAEPAVVFGSPGFISMKKSVELIPSDHPLSKSPCIGAELLRLHKQTYGKFKRPIA